MSATAQLNTALAGRYAIEREIGRGGMATVYLARDLRHDRLVALKVLDPELGAVLGAGRFLSEIRVTANLQHPNLLPLFDSGEADGLLYYTMPYVRGESLRTRLDRERQLPIDDAIHIATAVAGALDYAHGEGVIHRDLKPENVLLTGGEPLVADFGIALAVSRAGGARVTQTGLSLGTPQYMSPEQATADRVIDGRTDVYSLGAVTYEMLTGEPPHMGMTAQAIIARVLTEPAPHVAATRPSVPSNVDHAVARALEKLPADRWPSARAFGDALQGSAAEMAPMRDSGIVALRSQGSAWAARVRDPFVIGLLCTLAATAVVAAWGWARARSTPHPLPARLALTLPAGLRLQRVTGPPVVISPDGRALVIVASTSNGAPQLYYRPLASLEPRALAGTENVTSAPFFSPDGQWIGFFSRGMLKKVAVDGGEAISLATVPGGAGGAWGPGDVIVGGSNDGLWAISADGGAPRMITRVDTSRKEFIHSMPRFLPDGKSIVFDIDRPGGVEHSELGIVDLRTGKQARLGVNARNPVGYAAGLLIAGRPDLGIAGIPFDVRRWKVTGAPIALVQDVGFKFNGGVEASLADDGTLVYSRGAGSRLALVDEHGAVTEEVDAPRAYYSVRFAPDGQRLALAVGSGGASDGSATSFDVWLYDLASRTLSRLTSRGSAGLPAWAPDGLHVAYAVSPDGPFNAATEVWWSRADGSGSDERLFATPRGFAVNWSPSFTPDGRHLVVDVGRTRGAREIWDVPLDRPAAERHPMPLVRSSFNNLGPSVSPNGHWLAYASNETGVYEVYVRSFPGPGGRVQVSTGGGWGPVWGRSGRQLYYRQSSSGGPLLVANIALPANPAGEPSVVARREVFPGASGATETVGPRSYDARGDGKSFALIQPSARGDEIVVALAWRDAVLARERTVGHQ